MYHAVCASNIVVYFAYSVPAILLSPLRLFDLLLRTGCAYNGVFTVTSPHPITQLYLHYYTYHGIVCNTVSSLSNAEFELALVHTLGMFCISVTPDRFP